MPITRFTFGNIPPVGYFMIACFYLFSPTIAVVKQNTSAYLPLKVEYCKEIIVKFSVFPGYNGEMPSGTIQPVRSNLQIIFYVLEVANRLLKKLKTLLMTPIKAGLHEPQLSFERRVTLVSSIVVKRRRCALKSSSVAE